MIVYSISRFGVWRLKRVPGTLKKGLGDPFSIFSDLYNYSWTSRVIRKNSILYNPKFFTKIIIKIKKKSITNYVIYFIKHI